MWLLGCFLTDTHTHTHTHTRTHTHMHTPTHAHTTQTDKQTHAIAINVCLHAAAGALTIGMRMSKKTQRFQLYDLLFTLSPKRACIFKLVAARTCQLYDLLFAFPPARRSQNTRNRKVESRPKGKHMYY